MLKFIALIILFVILLRMGSYFLRLLMGQVQGVEGQGSKDRKQGSRRRGNLNVDRVPKEEKDRKDSLGGEYVDYEEVKD